MLSEVKYVSPFFSQCINLVILSYNLLCYLLSLEYELKKAILSNLYRKSIFPLLKYYMKLKIFLHVMFISYGCGIIQPNFYGQATLPHLL